MSEDARVFAAVEKLETAVERLLTRVEGLEVKVAASGKPSWESMMVGITLLISILGAAVSWVVGQTDRKAAEEKVGYLESRLTSMEKQSAVEIERERRLAAMETKMGLMIALRP